MAEPFDRDKSVVFKHLKAIYEEGELQREATVAKYATVQTEGSGQVERHRQSKKHRRNMMCTSG